MFKLKSVKQGRVFEILYRSMMRENLFFLVHQNIFQLCDRKGNFYQSFIMGSNVYYVVINSIRFRTTCYIFQEKLDFDWFKFI